MLTRELFDEFIARNGPFVYHYTDESAIESIIEYGIVPRSKPVRGRPETWRGKWASRRNHVYVKCGVRRNAYGLTKGLHRATFKIDVRKLDPVCLDVNEDEVGAAGWPIPKLPGYTKVAPNPKLRRPYVKPEDFADARKLEHPLARYTNTAVPEPWKSWGEWADAHSEIIDKPPWVLHSINRGTLTVRGGVPPEALNCVRVRPKARWRRVENYGT